VVAAFVVSGVMRSGATPGRRVAIWRARRSPRRALGKRGGRPRVGRPSVIGLGRWYLLADGSALGVMKRFLMVAAVVPTALRAGLSRLFTTVEHVMPAALGGIGRGGTSAIPARTAPNEVADRLITKDFLVLFFAPPTKSETASAPFPALRGSRCRSIRARSLRSRSKARPRFSKAPHCRRSRASSVSKGSRSKIRSACASSSATTCGRSSRTPYNSREPSRLSARRRSPGRGSSPSSASLVAERHVGSVDGRGACAPAERRPAL
jgi:hypothetical protein